jgi:hypothetical protein
VKKSSPPLLQHPSSMATFESPTRRETFMKSKKARYHLQTHGLGRTVEHCTAKENAANAFHFMPLPISCNAVKHLCNPITETMLILLNVASPKPIPYPPRHAPEAHTPQSLACLKSCSPTQPTPSSTSPKSSPSTSPPQPQQA